MAEPILLNLPPRDPRKTLYKRLEMLRTNMPRPYSRRMTSFRASTTKASSNWQRAHSVQAKRCCKLWLMQRTPRK